MERLTQKCILGGWTALVPKQEVVDRLAAYEDAGLEPGEVKTAVMFWGENAAQTQAELQAYRTLGAVEHLTELVKAQSEGRLVVLPCKVGDDVFINLWSIKNQKYEVCAGKIKNVRYDAIDGSVMVSNGEYYREWGKDAFSSRQEAEAALGGGGEE